MIFEMIKKSFDWLGCVPWCVQLLLLFHFSCKYWLPVLSMEVLWDLAWTICLSIDTCPRCIPCHVLVGLGYGIVQCVDGGTEDVYFAFVRGGVC